MKHFFFHSVSYSISLVKTFDNLQIRIFNVGLCSVAIGPERMLADRMHTKKFIKNTAYYNT
jgi:hypothetical protein